MRLVGEPHAEGDGGRGGDEVEVVLALEALADDLHVEEAEEPETEPEPERPGRLRLIDEGSVVETKLLEGVAQILEIVAVGGEDPGEDHGLGLVVTGKGDGRPLDGAGDRVTHLDPVDLLDPGDEVADLPRTQGDDLLGSWGEDADLVGGVLFPRRHEPHLLAGRKTAVEDPEIADDPPVGVVVGVEDEGAEGGVRVAARGGDVVHDPFEEVVDSHPRSWRRCARRRKRPRRGC